MKKAMSIGLIWSVLGMSMAQADVGASLSQTSPETNFIAQVYTLQGLELSPGDAQQQLQDAISSYETSVREQGLSVSEAPQRLEAALVQLNSMDAKSAHALVQNVVNFAQKPQTSQAEAQKELLSIVNTVPQGAQFSGCSNRLIALGLLGAFGGVFTVMTANNEEPQAGIGAGIFVASAVTLLIESKRCQE